MPAGKATIDWDGYELLVKFSPFNSDIVAEIKSSIPQHSRTWDTEDKCWRVSTIYMEAICGILEDGGYAIRDYTGTDTAAKLRQAELRKIRDDRLNDAERQREAAARKRAERDKEAAARRKVFEEARRAKANADWNAEFFRNHSKQTDFSQAYGGTHTQDQDDEWRKTQRQQTEWRARFKAAWPECEESDFKMWWSYFTLYGRAEANSRFNRLYRQRKQREKAFNDRGRRFDEEFFRRFFGGQATRVDHYAILGIVSTCTQDVAKAAFLKLAQQYHPNSTFATATPNEEKMKEVNAAWDAIKAERDWT